jgi:hypothetical protein
MPAHYQSFLISWLFAKSSVPTRHTRTRPEVCCQDRHPNSPPPLCPMKELCCSLWSGKSHENCEVPKLFGARHRNVRRCLFAL